MDYLKQLLAENGIEMDDEQLINAIKAMGNDPGSLNKPQSEQLLKLIIKAQSSQGLTKAGNNKPATKRASKRGDRKDAPDTAGLTHIAQQVDAEMGAFESGIIEFTDEQIQGRKQRIVETLQNAPVRLVQEVALECAEFGGDPAFFRGAAGAILKGFSPLDGGMQADRVVAGGV